MLPRPAQFAAVGVAALGILGGTSCTTITATRRAVFKPREPLGVCIERAAAAERAGELAAYNRALGEVMVLLEDHRQEVAATGLEARGAATVYRLTAPELGRRDSLLAPMAFVPAAELKIKGLKEHRQRDGVGLPLVASGDHPSPEEARRDKIPPAGFHLAETAMLRVGGTNAVLEFYDPLATETVRWHGRRTPLAADYTAPLAVLVHGRNPLLEGLIRMLRVASAEERARLARIRPGAPDRIPVVFVHGLMSSPMAWMAMVNELQADPEITKHYDFWFFAYPSGLPIILNARALREELDAALGPRGRCYNGRDMVLVGHSMGGILSRLMVTASGRTIWDEVAAKRRVAAPLGTGERKLLESLLIFPARDDVGRVVFIATPHRGTQLALSPVGRFGRSLIRLPVSVLNLGGGILKSLVVLLPGDSPVRRVPTSIDGLAPTNPVLLALAKLPVERGVPYHSIIGDRGKGDTPNSSDGVVAYSSSHLAGAASEKIVPCDHRANEHPAGIAEVHRILLEHLRRR